MTAPAWSTIEDAIATWIATGGVAVTWAGQPHAPRPAPPFVRMRLEGVRMVGQDWIDVVDAAAPTAGAEIEHMARGTRTLTLSLQAFVVAGTGALAAAAILEKIITAARLPTARDALTAAGIGLGTVGMVKSIDGVINSATFEPRAVVDILLHTVSEQVETGTYIETVETSGSVE